MTEITTVNPTTMTTLEIAKQTGKNHRNVTRDTRVMLVELYGKDSLLSFERSYQADNGQTYKCYSLPKNDVLTLVSGYSISLRAKIIRRLDSLEKRVKKVLTPVDVLSEELRAYALFEVPKHIAQIESVKKVHKDTGVDFSHILLSAPAQNNIKKTDVMLEPTELGKHFGVSAVKMNRELERLGLQVKTASGWEPTEKGSKVSIKHSWTSGAKSGYNYKWNLSNVEEIVNNEV